MSYEELMAVRAAEADAVKELVLAFEKSLSDVMSEKEFVVGKYTRHLGGWTCQRQLYMGVNHWRWVLEPPTATFYRAIGPLYQIVQSCRLVQVPTEASYSLWLREESRPREEESE